MEKEEEVFEPMSPTGQYLKSSALSVTIVAVLEFEFPIDDSMAVPLLRNLFLPINSRFSSIMVPEKGKKGEKKWKKVEVNLKDHIITPTFPPNHTPEYYDQCFTQYLSQIASQHLPQNRPLWELHIVKYPTTSAAGNIVFKLHHALGDGYSLMGSLLSCLQRADDPSKPLTFPSRQSQVWRDAKRREGTLGRLVSGVFHTCYDFWWSMMKSTVIEDDVSPVRSGVEGVEMKEVVTTTIAIPIDQLKEIKTRLNVTINDVITGIITFGIRLYMRKTSEESEAAANCTAIVILNSRALEGYKTVEEMIKPDSKMPWGNRFAFLHVPIPKCTEADLQNPLKFIANAQRAITRQRNSAVVYLTAQLLHFLYKIKGPEATGRFVHATMKSASLVISNLIGPIEKVAIPNQPIKGMYYFAPGVPQSLQLTMISYVGMLRIAITTEKGFIDSNKFKSCITYATQVMHKAAVGDPTN